MKHQYKCSMCNYLSQCLVRTRQEAGLTQSKFSKFLVTDTRSYADLNHTPNSCCMLSFILYLCFYCKDINGLVRNLKQLILDVYDQ